MAPLPQPGRAVWLALALFATLSALPAWSQSPAQNSMADDYSTGGIMYAPAISGDAWPDEELPSAAPDERVEQLEARVGELEASLASLHSDAAKSPTNDKAMVAFWGSEGFTAQSASGDFSFHAGGRIQVDAVALNDDGELVLSGAGDADAVSLRRARLRLEGVVYRTMQWCAEFDVANSNDVDPENPPGVVDPFGGDVINVIAPTDVWWTFTELPWVNNFRVGIQKEPLGLERLTSSRFLDFMERSYLQDAFYGPRNNGFAPGIAVFDWNESETVTWSLGGYKVTQNAFQYEVGDNEYALTGRLTCVPWAEHEDRKLIHLGVGASYRGLDPDLAVADGNLRIRSRAALRNGPGAFNPNLADTSFSGVLFADNQTLVGPEAAIVLGPWLLQSEFGGGFVNGTTFTPNGGLPTPVDQTFFHGGYAEALYFLTGEHRQYDRHGAKFDRVVPRQNFDVTRDRGFCGLGAWQIGARYSYLDLNDGLVAGGYIRDLTVGLNWFVNPHAKMQFNYILEHVQNTQVDDAGVITAVNDGNMHGFGVRFAFDF